MYIKLVLLNDRICADSAGSDTPKEKLNDIDGNAQDRVEHGTRRDGSEELLKTRGHREEWQYPLWNKQRKG